MSTITRLTLALASGILLGLRFQLLHLAVCAAVLLVASLHPRLQRPYFPHLILFLAIGMGAGVRAGRTAANDCRARIADGSTLSVTGVFDGRLAPDTTVSLIAETIGSGRGAVCRGAIRVRVPGRALRGFVPGAHVRLTGTWWSLPADTRWPVPPERTGTLLVAELRTIESNDGEHTLLRARTAAEERMRRLFGSRAGLAEALLLARRGGLDSEVRERFAAAGMAHVLAISGMHVGILAGVLLMLARTARLAAKSAAIVAAVGTLLYVVFLGAPWAAARAAFQAVMLLASRLLQRPADSVALLAFTALVLLAIDPLAILDAGFQLSFAGMWGILSLGPLVRRWSSGRGVLAYDVIVTSIAAMLATTPIAAMHFGQAAGIGVITNVVASPVLAACVPALALALVSDLVSSSAAGFIADGGGQLLDALGWIAHAGASVPGGHVAVPANSLLIALLAILAFLCAGAFLPSGPSDRASIRTRSRGSVMTPQRRRLAIRLAAAFLVWNAAPLVAGGGRGAVEIHAIDVGQGDAFAIRSPRGRWLLVDAGPRSETWDAGRSRVVPFLLSHGVRRLEVVILTHPHADHIGGVESVLETIPVGNVVDPSVATGQSLYGTTLAAARRAGVRWYAGRAGREISMDGMTLRVLSPEDSLLDAHADPNDYSVVFHLGYGRFGALFLGDAPRSVENRLVARFGAAIVSDVIKVGHHGSRTSTGDSLLHATRARVALVPVGARNRYGHPSPDVIMRLERYGVHVLRTDESGALLVRGRADGRVDVAASR